MRVHLRSYCYGCRRGYVLGDRWHRTYAFRRGGSRVGHACEWEYWIAHDGVRLYYRQGFATWDRAVESAGHAYVRLVSTISSVKDLLREP